MFRDQDMPVVNVYDHEFRAIRHDLTLDDFDIVELLFTTQIYVFETRESFINEFRYLELTSFDSSSQDVKEIP